MAACSRVDRAGRPAMAARISSAVAARNVAARLSSIRGGATPAQFGDHAMDLPPCKIFRTEQIAFSRSAVFGDQQMADRDVTRRHDIAAARIGAAEGIGEIGDDHAVAGPQARIRRTDRHRRARQPDIQLQDLSQASESVGAVRSSPQHREPRRGRWPTPRSHRCSRRLRGGRTPRMTM